MTLLETRSAGRRAERAGRITAAQGADILAVFAQASSTWTIVEVSEVDRTAR